MKRFLFIPIFVSVIAVLPLAAFAQTNTTVAQAGTPAASGTDASGTPYQFKSDGLLGCNQTGAYAMSVGSMSAIGGTYVPVSDAAVELNTGYLVYDECVLREIVDRLRESATAGLVRKNVNEFATARNGNSLASSNLPNEQLSVSDKAIVGYINNGILSTVNPAFQSQVKTAVVRNYYSQTRQQNGALSCGYSGDLKSLLDGSDFSWDGLAALENPACNPLGAYQLSSDLVQGNADSVLSNMMTQLNWGRGIYPTGTTDDYGNTITNTPGAFAEAIMEQSLTSGFRQTESANDLGQMVGALFTGLGTQALSDSAGLSSLNQSVGGQSSYLDQVAASASQGVINGAANAALQILNAASQSEGAYYQALAGIATNLTQTIVQIRGIENKCWDLITAQVCAGSAISYGNGTPTCSNGGVTYRVATSSVFSQSVINAQIAPTASTTLNALKNSGIAINKISQLLSDAAGTNSQDAQSIAIQQLDALTAQGALHSDKDVTSIKSQATSIASTMTALVTQIAQTWGGGDPANGVPAAPLDTANPYDPNSSWCNVNDPNVIALWENTWKQ